MADKLVRLAEDMSIIRRYVDMGDGTHAPTGASVAAPLSTGGLLTRRVIATADTNLNVVKASAGQIYGIELVNAAAYPVFVKLYNKATAPNLAADTPVMTIQVPAGGVREINRPAGVTFPLGIAYAATKAVADTDTTALVAADVVGSINYF